MTYLFYHLGHLIAPLLGDEVEGEGGNGVHFHLSDLASYTSYSHKLAPQNLKGNPRPDVELNLTMLAERRIIRGYLIETFKLVNNVVQQLVDVHLYF